MAVDDEWTIIQKNSTKKTKTRKNLTNPTFKYSQKDRKEAVIGKEESHKKLCNKIDQCKENLLRSNYFSEMMQSLVNSDVEQGYVDIICYGIGSIVGSSNSQYQLACALLLREKLYISGKLYFFDPIMNKLDEEFLEFHEITLIQENEQGKRVIQQKSLFFMPHCGDVLYCNLLETNWGYELVNLTILGNSFEAYNDRIVKHKERKSSAIIQMIPYLQEVKWKPMDIMKYANMQQAFNDTSIITFSHESLQLAEKMGVFDQLPSTYRDSNSQNENDFHCLASQFNTMVTIQ